MKLYVQVCQIFEKLIFLVVFGIYRIMVLGTKTPRRWAMYLIFKELIKIPRKRSILVELIILLRPILKPFVRVIALLTTITSKIRLKHRFIINSIKWPKNSLIILKKAMQDANRRPSMCHVKWSHKHQVPRAKPIQNIYIALTLSHG